uniref:Uncharacterized protein n=1 Tax=Ascaris lumbricoides TaxID=6252 RepID=A0A0M3IWB1_ASCLU
MARSLAYPPDLPQCSSEDHFARSPMRPFSPLRNIDGSAMARSLAYPPDLPQCSSEDHFARSPMRPFSPLRNIDGVADRYTLHLYKYAPRPSCSRGHDQQCASETCVNETNAYRIAYTILQALASLTCVSHATTLTPAARGCLVS